MKELPSNPSETLKRLNPHLWKELHKGMVMVTPPKPPQRIRQSSKPLMNKLESDFKQDYESNTHHTLIPQSIRFKLGNGIWYKPDFMLFIPAGVFAFEVKGPHSFRGGFENLKVAAHLYLNITWRLVWKEQGHWKEQTVLP